MKRLKFWKEMLIARVFQLYTLHNNDDKYMKKRRQEDTKWVCVAIDSSSFLSTPS